MKKIETIHLKTSNPNYGYQGQGPHTTMCQKGIPKEQTPEKYKSVTKQNFLKLAEDETQKINLCPKCLESLQPSKPVFVNPQTAYYQTDKLSGKVTLKSDGKISISINGSAYALPSEKYKFKNLGKAIVEANFVHPAIYKLEKTNIFGLNARLKEETKELKEAYIEKTIIYAENYFANTVKKLSRPLEEWYKEFKIEFVYKTNYRGDKVLGPKTYNSKDYYKMQQAIRRASDLIKMGLDKFKSDEIRHAEHHYQDSIVKLAIRLNEKGITDESELEITHSRIGLNLEMVIKHGDMITKAWTIVAEGPIQRAHYRYLVK